MQRKRTSVIWSISNQEFVELVMRSTSYRKVLKHFGLDNKGGNGKTLKERIKELGIDDSHIRNKSKWSNAHLAIKISHDKLFVVNSKHTRGVAKRRIIIEGLIDHTVCAKCRRKNEWDGEELNLILDHINGISNDHRLENLRFLCPNCNSQTKTFAGRQNKKRHTCSECGEQKKTKQSKLCSSCSKASLRKVDRPKKDELETMINSMSWCAIGRKYSVSDNAVRKWARQYNLI